MSSPLDMKYKSFQPISPAIVAAIRQLKPEFHRTQAAAICTSACAHHHLLLCRSNGDKWRLHSYLLPLPPSEKDGSHRLTCSLLSRGCRETAGETHLVICPLVILVIYDNSPDSCWGHCSRVNYRPSSRRLYYQSLSYFYHHKVNAALHEYEQYFPSA